MAWRQGYTLAKSRRRDPRAVDFGNWWIVNPYNNALMAGGDFGMALDDVEEWLES